MSQHDAISLAGSVFVVLSGLAIFRILAGHWWCYYGRLALFVAAFTFIGIGVIRIANLLDIIDSDGAFSWATLLYGSTCMSYLLICIGHVAFHRIAGPHEGRTT